MAHQVTLQEAAGQLSELVREAEAGREIVLLDGARPVAKLTSLAGDEFSSDDIARLAMAGGAFDWLTDEPDLYEDDPADAVTAVRERLRQWQQEYGLPIRPNGKSSVSAEALFAEWDAEDSRLTPDEASAEQQMWADSQDSRQGVLI